MFLVILFLSYLLQQQTASSYKHLFPLIIFCSTVYKKSVVLDKDRLTPVILLLLTFELDFFGDKWI